ncbi:SMP-30/gluconolactonase/LRE family protein [Novosphingobium sp. YJ-S2-02]|uniref:SMP-30/gluconolactonase/LRE family protein n=1 Tax=Novosphingobium aureum TaxID=2792964 RepID=A0A931MM32_9SPHN|nr:SMP-30/gluconolactonase/LRE family protein [Novosphingobium aureum]MBH0114593.1 SMP-30/gluconolactonase/LRE family protein [Novosphingobium aureum]
MEPSGTTRATAPDFEVIASGFDFIEAPRITSDGAIWFSDLTAGGVYRCRSGEEPRLMLPERQWVGGIVIDRSGQVLCSGRGGIVALDPESGATREVLGAIEGQALGAVNDMEGDGHGGFYAGSIDFAAIFETGTPPAPGMLFHMSASGEVTVLRRDVAASNGMALSPCGAWLYHVETGRGIWRYPLGQGALTETGVAAGELFVSLEDGDGLALDSAGNLWVACWSTARLLHLAPDGTSLETLSLPYPHVVSICFAPDDPGSLYIATGGNGEAPRKGAILRMAVAVPGLTGAPSALATLEENAP